MRRNWAWPWWGILLLWPWCVWPQAARKTLARVEDPVVLGGALLESLAGVELADLNLFSCAGSACRPIPFQVDKRDAEGHYVFTNDSLRPAGRDGTRLDANDELVFMAADAGDRADGPARFPGAKRVTEIKLGDPRSPAAGWVYAAEAPGTERSREDYIQFVQQGSRLEIQTPLYQRILEIGKPGSSAKGVMRLRRPDGSWGEDVLDTFIAGMYVQFLRVAVPIAYPEYLVRERVIGAIDGPVRLVMGAVRVIYIGPISFQFGTEVVSYNYRNQGTARVDAVLPFSPRTLARSAYTYWGIDFTEAVLGSQYYDPAQSGPVMIDGKVEKAPELKTDHDWWALSGPQGAIMDVIILDPKLGELVVRGGLLEEKPEQASEKEEHPGSPRIGFGLLYFEKLDKGAYHWNTYHFFPHPFSRAKAEEFLDLILHPLRVTAAPLVPG